MLLCVCVCVCVLLLLLLLCCRVEEGQLAERAGEAPTNSKGSKAGSFMASLARNRTGGNK